MSFAMPPIRPREELNRNRAIPRHSLKTSNSFSVTSLLTHGFGASPPFEPKHPLEVSEKEVQTKHTTRLNKTVLRNTQGLHAPLRITMELRAVSQIGRLPFLPSSNAMLDAITGKDLEIGPEDVYNTPEYGEVAGQPHAMIEHLLGIL